MRILSFDTSTPDVQIALLEDVSGEVVTVASLRISPADSSRQESASKLIPSIDQILKENRWRKTDIDLVVAGVGPGSFTGTRVSVITARSLGQGLVLGVLPICTLELLARRCVRPVAVISSGGAGHYFAAAYAADLNAPAILPPFCAKEAEMQERLKKVPARVIAEGVDASLFLAIGNEQIPYPEIANVAVDAGLLAFERLKYLAQPIERDSLSKAYPWDNVLPLYLRSPSVTLKAGHGSSAQAPGRC